MIECESAKCGQSANDPLRSCSIKGIQGPCYLWKVSKVAGPKTLNAGALVSDDCVVNLHGRELGGHKLVSEIMIELADGTLISIFRNSELIDGEEFFFLEKHVVSARFSEKTLLAEISGKIEIQSKGRLVLFPDSDVQFECTELKIISNSSETLRLVEHDEGNPWELRLQKE